MKKSPGKAPLGHSPFGKEKLEGPKIHHDNHGMDASVPAKGSKKAVPGEHWEREYHDTVHKDRANTRGVEFSPIQASKRMTTYNKINECDH